MSKRTIRFLLEETPHVKGYSIVWTHNSDGLPCGTSYPNKAAIVDELNERAIEIERLRALLEPSPERQIYQCPSCEQRYSVIHASNYSDADVDTCPYCGEDHQLFMDDDHDLDGNPVPTKGGDK